MTREIRLLLVDDHVLFLGGIAHLLESDPRFTVVGCAATIDEGWAQLIDKDPDIVLLDVDLGDSRAIDLLRRMRARQVQKPVLLVTAGVSDIEAMQLIHEGAQGIFHKHNPPQQLIEAVLKVAAGEAVLEGIYLKSMFAALNPEAIDPRPKLSERELALMRHLLQGMANKEIATAMAMSESAVKSALRALFDKLGVKTRSQAVKVALEQYRDLI